MLQRAIGAAVVGASHFLRARAPNELTCFNRVTSLSAGAERSRACYRVGTGGPTPTCAQREFELSRGGGRSLTSEDRYVRAPA